jgi:hypothetical protein
MECMRRSRSQKIQPLCQKVCSCEARSDPEEKAWSQVAYLIAKCVVNNILSLKSTLAVGNSPHSTLAESH